MIPFHSKALPQESIPNEILQAVSSGLEALLLSIYTREQGIISYFLKIKFNETKQLILEDELSLTQISEKLGFCTPTYFSHVFKKYIGITPAQFKQENSSKKTKINTQPCKKFKC